MGGVRGFSYILHLDSRDNVSRTSALLISILKKNTISPGEKEGRASINTFDGPRLRRALRISRLRSSIMVWMKDKEDMLVRGATRSVARGDSEWFYMARAQRV